MKNKNMKPTSKKTDSLFSIKNYIFFFSTTWTLCLMSTLIYAKSINGTGGTDGTAYDWFGFAAVFANVFLVSALITTADALHRRFTIELPVKRILKALKELTRGNYDVYIEPPYTRKINEFDEIIDSINQMSKELASTEIMKTDFISNVSHEIKTPLSIIHNYAVLLQDASLDETTRQDYVGTILDASKRLSGLTTNMLKLNRLEHQNILPEFTYFNIGEQTRNILLSYEELWTEKNLEINADIEDITIYSDEGLLEIIWSNLISNAIKFTPENGQIYIQLEEEKDSIFFLVQDSGCGMDEATGKHIFDKFYQGDTSHAKEGNGLGLAMVKRVIDLLDGEIRVKSIPNYKTTFFV
ncbi:MAG: HAMP domain-containing sensor histidine kinase, partial [Lachnospiraceae bacterium]|nr:HAMP domain-containing sensor histidine kinase [Lachnospiraceae bacterium]